jgi:DNA-binding NarL/FixJ family response regulator
MSPLVGAVHEHDAGGRASGGAPRGPRYEERQVAASGLDTRSVPPPAPPSTGRLRVLIVDDEPAVRFMLDAVFRRDDRFELAGVAVDGREAIERAGRLRPDAVLLDLVMPGLSGKEALPAILRASPRSMVLVLSALRAEDEAAGTLAVGAFAYLEKSVMGPDLPQEVFAQHQRFARALAGETVWSPHAPWRVRR